MLFLFPYNLIGAIKALPIYSPNPTLNSFCSTLTIQTRFCIDLITMIYSQNSPLIIDTTCCFFHSFTFKDQRLQFACMKLESLVIAIQSYDGEICSWALYTPPVTLWELAMPEVITLTARRGMPKARLVIGVKS